MNLTFFEAELIFAVIWFGVRIILAAIRRKADLKREGVMLLLYVNLAVILRIVYFKMENLAGLHIGFARSNLRLNLIPFVNMFDYPSLKNIVLNIAGNILMFVPVGILLPVLYKRMRSFGAALFAGFSLSLLIELSQLLMPRVTDIDDLILNTAGVALGYLIYAAVRRSREGRSRSRRSE